MVHVLNAEKLIWNDVDFSALTDAKTAKSHCMITMALQSYKIEAHGGEQWGPARVAEGMLKLYGVRIEPKAGIAIGRMCGISCVRQFMKWMFRHCNLYGR